MSKIDKLRKQPGSLKPTKKKALYLEKSAKASDQPENSQTGILGKLSERLSAGKKKVSSLLTSTRDSSSKGRLSKKAPASTALTELGRIEIPGILPDSLPISGKNNSSILAEDTPSMARKRRLLEQDGHRQLAKVHAREHNEETQEAPAPEGELQNSIQQHPWLDAQRFDGVDPNLNPEPPLNTDARREFDNERREQEMEKQLRLGNMPKFSTAPKPNPR